MAKGARVTSIDVIRRFRAALCTFIEEASMALGEAQADVQRTLWWLEHDQVRHWERQIRMRSEKVTQAKSELYRAQMAQTPDGTRPSAMEERKLVRRWEAALTEAETKLKRTKHWAQMLQREQLTFRGQCQSLSSSLNSDLPRAVAKMEAMIENLQAYVDIAPPTTEVTGIAGADVDEDQASMARPVGAVSEHASYRGHAPDQETRDALEVTNPDLAEDSDRLVEPNDPAILRKLGLEGRFVSLSDKVVITAGALEERRIVAERSDNPAPSDTGWFVRSISDNAEEGSEPLLEAITVSELLERRPALRDLLALPPGFLAVFAGDSLLSVLNPENEEVWNA